MEENTLIRLYSLESVLYEYAEEVARFYRENLASDDRVATNDLINSVEARIAINKTAYQVQLRLLEYWKYVEWDTKPHMPPIDAILKWVEVKPVIPSPRDNGTLPTPKQLAWSIAGKIKEKGTVGTHTLARTLEEVNARYIDRISEALSQDLGESFHAWIVEYLVNRE